MRLLLPGMLGAALLGVAGCAPEGKDLFEREGCLSCHSFKGRGGSMGPDLTAVTGRMSDEQIIAQIRGKGPGNTRSRMPPYDHLSGREVKALLRALKQ